MSAEDLQTADDRLIESLRAFGQSLESDVDQSIRPGPTTLEQVSDRRSRSIAWLAAAAAVLLVAAGFGLGVVWPDRTASIDSVGDETDIEQPSPTTIEPPDRVTPEDAEAELPLDLGPSTIDGADGSVLATITIESLIDRQGQTVRPTESRSEVLVGAVAEELATLDAFASYDPSSLRALLADGGLQITTTLDPRLHEVAAAGIDELYPNPEGLRFEVGMITVDNRTGAIVDITSSRPGSDALLTSPRPPGSAMKTFVLAALFEDGYRLEDTVRADGPCRFTTADGATFTVGGSERQTQSIAAVTRSSNNCAFVRLGQVVGIDRVLEVSDGLGLDLDPAVATPDNMSIPLGGIGVDATQLAGAYAALANDGAHIEPWLIQSVSDANGTELYRHEAVPRQVVSIDTAQQITQVLTSNVESGTGRRASLEDGHVAAGKTGTTDGFTNAWFVGYTGYYTAAVWLGSPAGESRIRIPGWNGFGGGLPAAIWGRYMNEVHRDLDPIPFPITDREVEPRLLVAPNEQS